MSLVTQLVVVPFGGASDPYNVGEGTLRGLKFEQGGSLLLG